MPDKLLDILFKSYRRQVLNLLLLNPGQQYHVREVARLTATVAGTVHKELSKLEQAGILKKSQQGNQICYSADTSCPIYKELTAIFTKTTVAAKPVLDSNLARGNNIELLQSMLDAIQVINQNVDNKIQLSHSADAQYTVMKHLRELLRVGELLADSTCFELNGIKAILANEKSVGLESVWTVVKHDLPILEQQLISAIQ